MSLSISVESFIQNFLLRIGLENLRNDYTSTTNTVLLRKRYRDRTPDDNFGIFDNYGAWSAMDTSNLERMNIIKPMVKANTAAMVSANVVVDIVPRVTDDANAEMVADVARAIRDLKTEEQWTHQMNEQLATEVQVAPGAFIHTSWNDHAKNNFVSSIDEWEDTDIQSSTASCPNCGYETQVQDDVIPDDDGQATIPCDNCGQQAPVTSTDISQMPMISGSKNFKAGNTQTVVIPSSEILIDSLGTQGGNIKAAKWMMHRYLAPMEELNTEYPESEDKIRAGLNSDWSYPLRWQHALQTGNDLPFRDQTQMVTELREVRDLYLTPQAYQHVEVNTNFDIGDTSTRFTVAAGQKFTDAKFNGQPLEENATLCFRTIGNLIIDVFPAEFRDGQFIYTTFLSDPSSFWGNFLTEMLPLQDVVNYMFTIQIVHTRRNARTTKVGNSGAFNPEDFEKDLVLTKEPMPFDMDINHTFATIQAATLSSAPMELIKTVLEVTPSIGGVTPAMTGQAQPGETYSAVRQQKERSMGQLSPYSISIAMAKVEWTLRQLKEAQIHWTEEDFLFLLKMNGEWTEEYIEAFLGANLDTDIILDYEPGSESPRDLLERELALTQFISTLGQLAEMGQSGSPLITPELMGNILQQTKQLMQVNVDVANTDKELRLADTRYDKICHIVDQMPIPPNAPIAQLQQMAQQILLSPDLQPSEYEDVGSEIEYYKEKITRELTKDAPNFLKVAIFSGLIKAYKQAKVAEAQEDTTNQMAAQAPMLAAQQQDAAAQNHPQNKILETMNYANTPPDIQRQMEQQAGFQPSQMPPQPNPDQTKAAVDSAKIVAENQRTVAQNLHQVRTARQEHLNNQTNKLVDAHIEAHAREHQANLDVQTAKQMPKPTGASA